MTLIVIIDVLAVGILTGLALVKGLERALPFAAFVLVVIPREAGLHIPGLFDITTQRIVLVVLIVLYLILPRESADGQTFKTPLKWLIVIHIVWCLISTANSIVPLMSVKKMIAEVAEYYLLYFIYFKTIHDVRTIHRILYAIVAAVIVCSVFGTFEAYWGWSILSWFPMTSSRFQGDPSADLIGRGLRVESAFPHPILFGAALVMAITLAIYLLTITKQSRRKVFLWAGLALMFLNLYKTESRGPWLGLILSLTLLLFLDQQRVRKFLTVLAVLTALVLVIRPGVWESVRNIYYGTIDPDNPLSSSYDYRFALRDVAVQALSRSFAREVWGYGLESFYDLHLMGELGGKPYAFLSCDSAWIELMMDTGYVGLVIMGTLLLMPAWMAWRDFRELPRPDRYLSLSFFVIMVAYYFMMLSVAMYAWGQNSYMLWLVISVSIAYRRLIRTETSVADSKTVNRIDNSATSAGVPRLCY